MKATGGSYSPHPIRVRVHETEIDEDLQAVNDALWTQVKIVPKEVHGRLFPVTVCPMGLSGIMPRQKGVGWVTVGMRSTAAAAQR